MSDISVGGGSQYTPAAGSTKGAGAKKAAKGDAKAKVSSGLNKDSIQPGESGNTPRAQGLSAQLDSSNAQLQAMADPEKGAAAPATNPFLATGAAASVIAVMDLVASLMGQLQELNTKVQVSQQNASMSSAKSGASAEKAAGQKEADATMSQAWAQVATAGTEAISSMNSMRVTLKSGGDPAVKSAKEQLGGANANYKSMKDSFGLSGESSKAAFDKNPPEPRDLNEDQIRALGAGKDGVVNDAWNGNPGDDEVPVKPKMGGTPSAQLKDADDKLLYEVNPKEMSPQQRGSLLKSTAGAKLSEAKSNLGQAQSAALQRTQWQGQLVMAMGKLVGAGFTMASATDKAQAADLKATAQVDQAYAGLFNQQASASGQKAGSAVQSLDQALQTLTKFVESVTQAMVGLMRSASS